MADRSPGTPSAAAKGGPASGPHAHKLDVIVVGGGIAGIYALYKFRSLGFSTLMIEAGSDVGGTWFWNRYPGCRCDVESVEYSYSFSDELQQSWSWSEKYATQGEILRYLQHVAHQFDLYRDIKLDTRVISAVYDEEAALWRADTDTGEQYACGALIMATGPLSIPVTPSLPGIEDFKGEVYHTGQWPDQKVDFTGQRVGVVGTGSSGVQAVPMIAQQATHLTVFQRTPNYSVPARNKPLTAEEMQAVKSRYPQMREAARASGFGTSWSASESGKHSALELEERERIEEYERRWERGGAAFLVSFNDLLINRESNMTAGDFLRSKIRSIVKDPKAAEALSPARDLPLGCKRICVDTDYYATFNRENVDLVDLRATPVERITASGLKTSEAEYALDSLVLATGFDAMTGALMRITVRGRDGATLQERWSHGATNYLGISVAGFPNLFMVNGPGSPSVLANMVLTAEQTVDFVAQMLVRARDNGTRVIEAQVEAENEWVATVNGIADMTMFNAGCNSWYVGANVPGKPRMFLAYAGGLDTYTKLCGEIAEDDYRGFNFA